MALTALDMLVLLTVGVAGVFGFMRGFVAETISLAAWILAVAAVTMVHAPISQVLVGVVGTQSGAAVLAFVIVFAVTFGMVRLVGGALGRTTRNSVLGPFDRLLGLAFGAVKGLVSATFAFLLISLVFDTLHGKSAARPEWMTHSRSYSLLRASSEAMTGFVQKRRAL